MNNDNTYKLSWGGSILETIGEKDITGDLLISYDELSERIIKYYWNQLYFFNLTQGSNKIKPPLVEQIVRKMIEDYQEDTDSKIPVWYGKAESYFKAIKRSIQKSCIGYPNPLIRMSAGDSRMLAKRNIRSIFLIRRI